MCIIPEDDLRRMFFQTASYNSFIFFIQGVKIFKGHVKIVGYIDNLCLAANIYIEEVWSKSLF